MERDGTWFPKKYSDNIIVFKILQEKLTAKQRKHHWKRNLHCSMKII
jgi:hypothetical protein